jgi:hypothetical protein
MWWLMWRWAKRTVIGPAGLIVVAALTGATYTRRMADELSRSDVALCESNGRAVAATQTFR